VSLVTADLGSTTTSRRASGMRRDCVSARRPVGPRVLVEARHSRPYFELWTHLGCVLALWNDECARRWTGVDANSVQRLTAWRIRSYADAGTAAGPAHERLARWR